MTQPIVYFPKGKRWPWYPALRGTASLVTVTNDVTGETAAWGTVSAERIAWDSGGCFSVDVPMGDLRKGRVGLRDWWQGRRS